MRVWPVMKLRSYELYSKVEVNSLVKHGLRVQHEIEVPYCFRV
jgi:hypothetical protein